MTTQDKIIHSAVELFIAQGIAGTTTREIAASANVAEGSIYRYYPSKDELAWQIFKDFHQQLAHALLESVAGDADFEEKILSLVSCFLDKADKDWLMFRYYLTSQHTHMKNVSKQMLTPYQVIHDVINHAVRKDEIHIEQADIVIAMVMGAVHQIAINKIYHRIKGDLYPHRQLAAKTIANMFQQET